MTMLLPAPAAQQVPPPPSGPSLPPYPKDQDLSPICVWPLKLLTRASRREQRQQPAPQARDLAFQDQLLDRLATLTGVALV